MPEFTRALSYQSPLLRGTDVLYAQRALRTAGLTRVETDGLFGAQTSAAVQQFQRRNGLSANGVVDANTWNALFAASPVESQEAPVSSLIAPLLQPHQFRDSVAWCLTERGIAISGLPAIGTPGQPQTISSILDSFGKDIESVSANLHVPAELIVATIATESSGNPNAMRREPGWTSDAATPHRVSIGLMQTLISTAQAMTSETVTAQWLTEPSHSIDVGTKYIASQKSLTGFDPPKVACAYNAGGLYYEPSTANRWRMRQYPLGTSAHADRFVAFFNDCFAVLRTDGRDRFTCSFAREFAAGR